MKAGKCGLATFRWHGRALLDFSKCNRICLKVGKSNLDPSWWQSSSNLVFKQNLIETKKNWIKKFKGNNGKNRDPLGRIKKKQAGAELCRAQFS